MELAGKVALVTGAGRRVGRAITLELARAGCDVALHCNRSITEAKTLAEQIQGMGRRAVVVRGDLIDADTPPRIVAEAVAALGRLDVLVNNASVFDSAAIQAWTDEHWQRTLVINAVAPAMLARAAAEHMQKAGQGRIVNLTDIMVDRPGPELAAYCASKAALVSITRSLARELAPEITVNGVSPGIAIFPEYYSQELREKLVNRVPLQRSGSPEEIASVVRFLVATADYVTGQILAVDGGRSVVQ